MQLTAVLTPAEEGGFVAMNPETGTTTQGATMEEAIENLQEAAALYLDEFPHSSVGHPLVTMFSLPEPVKLTPCQPEQSQGGLMPLTFTKI